ncbi:hypothetical protein BJ508DRAFT_360897, partial [Ascobolus immersus RN42]
MEDSSTLAEEYINDEEEILIPQSSYNDGPDQSFRFGPDNVCYTNFAEDSVFFNAGSATYRLYHELKFEEMDPFAKRSSAAHVGVGVFVTALHCAARDERPGLHKDRFFGLPPNGNETFPKAPTPGAFEMEYVGGFHDPDEKTIPFKKTFSIYKDLCVMKAKDQRIFAEALFICPSRLTESEEIRTFSSAAKKEWDDAIVAILPEKVSIGSAELSRSEDVLSLLHSACTSRSSSGSAIILPDGKAVGTHIGHPTEFQGPLGQRQQEQSGAMGHPRGKGLFQEAFASFVDLSSAN